MRAVVALACLLLAGMASLPPYVNPLTAEQLAALRLSEIRFEHLQDGSIDAEKAAKAAALVRTHLIERLGGKLTPGKGNAVLVVPLRLEFKPQGRVSLRITGKIIGKIAGTDISADYPGANLDSVGILPRAQSVPVNVLDSMSTFTSANLARQILCCVNGAMSQDITRTPPKTPPPRT
jgi:hypothetical protein